MLRKPISFIFAAVLLSTAAAAISAPILPPGVVKDDYKDIMPLSQVKPGMKGYGLTVFRGTKIEKFNVEVLSIMRKMNNGKDLILARMSGGPITARQANIMQGMSGSPVYVNGKIIGAVAYGPGSFSKEPLAMLTPIEDMLDSLDPNLPAHPSGLSTYDGTGNIKVSTGPDGLVMTPLMTPLMVSGMSQRNISKLAEMLQPFGLLPMAGPGGGSQPDNGPASLVPGAAFGLALASGDVDMTAVGTLTYRRGNKVIGFGHPMFGIGPIDAPLTTAYVHDVFPSYQISSKIASPIKTVGRISQDRPWSVGGEVGVMAHTIPLTIDVDDRSIGRKRTLHVNVINHPLLAAKLIMMTATEAISEVHGIPSDATAHVRMEIDADQVGKIVRDNVFFDPTSIESASLDDVQGIINILANNKFYPVDVKSIRLVVTITPGRKTASVERITVDKAKYEPGDTINISVDLRPYKGDRFTRNLSLKIPENAPDGRMSLQVRGGMSGGGGGGPMFVMLGGDGSQGPMMMPGGSSSGSADNIKQLISKYLEREKNNDLVAKLTLPGSSVSISGEKLSGLPDPIAGVMKSSRTSTTRLEKDDVKTVVPMDYVLTGDQNVSVKVERMRHAEKRQPSAPPSAPEPQMTPPSMPPPTMDIGDDTSDESGDFGASTHVKLDKPAAPSVTVESESPADDPADDDKPAASSSAAPEAAEPPKDHPKPESTSAEKPVARQPIVWKQTSYKDFSLGTPSGVSASTEDDLRMVPMLAKLSDLPESFAWSVISDGQDGAYVGTGNNGTVYHVTSDGKASSLYKTGELEVHALALDGKGDLYAGTSPHGKVFRVSPDGKGSLLYAIPDKYVLALTTDTAGDVYAAAGDSGHIYKIGLDGAGKLFATLNENSVLSMTSDKSGALYVGTGRDGVVYKIGSDGAVSPLFNAPEDAVTSVAVDSRGTVYAGTGSGKGNVYKISQSGSTKTVYDKAPHALSMAADSSDNIYVTSDEQILKISPDETVTTLDTQKCGAQFISVAAAPGGAIFAGTANGGAIFAAKPPTQGTYESAVRDAGAPSRWGMISWVAGTPSGSSVSVRTRTGNIAEPDSSWSPWSAAYSTAAGLRITSPSARYIQYRVTFAGTTTAAPSVSQISLAYLPENKPPKVTISEPQGRDVISHTQTIKWSGSDPDKDTLTYDIYYSADSGKTWQRIGSGVNPDKPAAPATPAVKPAAKPDPKHPAKPDSSKKSEPKVQPSKTDLVDQLKAGLDQHSDIPQDVKDKMVSDVSGAIDKSISASTDESEPKDNGPASPGNAANGSTKQTSYSWDTTKVADGDYLIKVLASDRISNATGYLTDDEIVGPVTVENTPPKVETLAKTLKVNSDGAVYIEGLASDKAGILGVQFKVDTGDWMAAAATDGMFDTPSEPFSVTTQPLAKGKHTIEVKAIDAAGNAASTKVDANVP